jgi:hypothetical protein
MPNGTTTTPQPPAEHRSAITARPDARLNGNSRAGRRVRDLYRALMHRLGEPSDPVAQGDILAVAEMRTLAESARLRLLEGKDQDTNGLIRLENVLRRCEARVGLTPAGAPTEDSSNPFGILLGLDDEEPAK